MMRKMRNILYFALAAFQVGLLVSGKGLYSVVGPGTIRSNFKYNVALTLHESDEPSKFEIGITGPSYNKTESLELQPMSTKNIEFDIPKLESGDYNLIVKGLSGLKFENSTKLEFSEFTPAVYIQTDKATYKPGDLVKYRVIFLDENTRPAKVDTPISIVINDGAKNRIKQIDNVELTKGVFSGELQLSEQPVLGKWNIDVLLNGQEKSSKGFEVDKYVLPKFDVKIETAKDVAIPDGVITATIRSTYTYGKPVKGMATVSIEPSYSYYGDQSGIMATKTIPVDGKGRVTFELGKDLTISENVYVPPLKVFAIMTEDLTGNQYNASAVLTLHRNRYRIEGVDTPSVFTPDKPLKLSVAVKHVDGSPVTNTNKKVKLSLMKSSPYYSWRQPVIERDSGHLMRNFDFEAPVDSNGIASFEFTIPDISSNYYAVMVSFEDTSTSLSSLRKATPERKVEEETMELLKINLITENPRLGKDVVFEVKSRENLPYFVYAIVARGNIVKMEYVKLPDGEKEQKVKITPTFEMVPKASIFIHYVHNNDLRFEESTINFNKDFENSIDITAPTVTKPGEEVELNIHTDPDSYVGLLGVDQSVLLLKSGNDFNRDDILNKLNDYETRTPYIRGHGRYPGRDAGLITMTNANFPFEERVFRRPALKIGYRTGITLSRSGSNNRLSLAIDSKKPQNPVEFKIRKDFSENWIFIGYINTEKDGFSLKKKIPDTITSWVVTGFALSPKTGFAMTKDAAKIKVFQPFFISTNLPYSVKRGEVIAIPVIIFNYMEKALDTDITMDNLDNEYKFTEATNEIEESEINEKQRTKHISIPPNSGKSVSFMIRPNIVGDITLKITAISPLAGDSILKKLKVEPEGITQFGNKAVFVTLKDKKEEDGQLKVDFPPEIVPDSEYIEMSVVGDLLGPTLKNLDKLVRMPSGCGEQNMVNFVPNILVLKYLDSSGRKMPNIQEKARKFVEIGYQRELTYKHDDGSYSAFGKSDKAGSTWLTAYVIREFHRAKPYTDIDPKVLKEGIDFLISKQAENGSFPEYGKLFDNSHQNEFGLTSFVLIALLENHEIEEQYRVQTAKAADFIAKHIDEQEDLYTLALAYIALQQTRHPAARKLLARIEPLAHEENGLKWWSQDKKQAKADPWYYAPRTNDVEITSYIFLALMTEKSPEELLPIIRWLISQRNSNGGFASTQDTVTGLYALSSFAQLTGSGQGEMKVSFTSNGDDEVKGSFDINPDNSLVLHSYVLPKSARLVDFKAEGSGSALVQLSYQYNIADKEKKPSFKVTSKVKDSAAKNLLNVHVCTEFIPLEGAEKQDSNMAVIEIGLPSGYTVDTDKFADILAVDRVKRTETKNSDSTVIVYFDSLTPSEEKCIPVQAIKSHAVAKQKPAAVSVYDYYDPNLRATDYYEVVSSLCDICEGDDCGAGCKKE